MPETPQSGFLQFSYGETRYDIATRVTPATMTDADIEQYGEIMGQALSRLLIKLRDESFGQ